MKQDNEETRRGLLQGGSAAAGKTADAQERDLCVAYGDHDECPYTETDENGAHITCSCSCHLFPGAMPE